MKYNKQYVETVLKTNPNLKFFGFWGQKSESDLEKSFSNFYQVDFMAPLLHGKSKGTMVKFTCSEQYFMYHKAVVFNDYVVIEDLLINGKNGNYYKSLGRKVGNTEINKDADPFDHTLWDSKSYDCMIETLKYKFQNPKLKKYLLSTKDSILVETSPMDGIWGIKLGKTLRDGSYDKSEKWKNPDLWLGENKLGFALMEVRDLLNLKK